MVSSSHMVSATPSSSWEGLLTLLPCSSMGSLPQETVLHDLLQHGYFPQAAVLHKLLQHGSFPQGAVLQEQAAAVWVPHVVTSPASKPAPEWAPHGVTASFGHPLLWCGVLHVLQVETCSTVDHHGLQGTACLTMVFSTCCRGISTPAPGAPLPPSLTLGAAELFLSYSHSSLQLLLHRWFFSLLKYVITEVLPPSPMGSALASSRSVLEPAGIGSIGHQGSFQHLLTEATPVAPSPPVPKILPHKPATVLAQEMKNQKPRHGKRANSYRPE